MNFDSAAEILTAVQQMQWASQPVQINRAKINRLFNGDPPWTEEERKRNRLNTNFNYLEPTRIAANSRFQIYNAFFTPGHFFDITLPDLPIELKDKWSNCLSTYINAELRKSKQFCSALEQAFAQVVLHGPGPLLWTNRHCPSPNIAGVDDVVLPAGTLCDMSNLDRFAIYQELTWSQLYDYTQDDADPGWNKKYIKALLESLYKQPLQPLYQGNRWMFPEKIAEDQKENASAWGSSALGRVLVWNFYFRDEKSGKWNRRILLDYANIPVEGVKNSFDPSKRKAQFLYQRDDYADEWQHIIHWFVGNCSNVAPFRYYSVRSVGYLLYGVCYIQNMIRNRMTDHVLQALLTWFRNVSEDDREQLEDISLQHLGIFPEGVSMVNAGERYTADWNLITMGLNQNRQLMAESATSFLPDIAVEGEKPAMTATESLIRNNASVTLSTAVLNQLYNQAEPFYREVCRRFCIDSDDPMVKNVRKLLKRDGIPMSILKESENWEIRPNRMMGGGNKAVELTTARALFESRGAFGSAGSVLATRKYVLALTGNAEEAEQIVPNEPEISDATVLANLAFGTLMQGVPFVQKKGINESDYIETLIQLMALAMKPLEAMQSQPQAIGTMAEKISGILNVASHTEQHIQVLSMDPMAKEKVRDYQRAVNNLMSQLRGYGQRLSEMEQAQQGSSGLDAETQAKIISMQAMAQTKAEIAAANAAIKQQHKDVAFVSEQSRRDAQTVAEIKRKDAMTAADVAAKDLTTRADLIHQSRQAQVDRENKKAENE